MPTKPPLLSDFEKMLKEAAKEIAELRHVDSPDAAAERGKLVVDALLEAIRRSKPVKKRIAIVMDNGAAFYLDAAIVAKHRATAMANEAVPGPNTILSPDGCARFTREVYDREYEYGFNNDWVLKDWLQSKMEWADIASDVYVANEPPKPNYRVMFKLADLLVEII